MPKVSLIFLCAILSVAGCRDQQPPAPTSEESAQLNEAEDMLNDLGQNEKGPEQSPGPSSSSN